MALTGGFIAGTCSVPCRIRGILVTSGKGRHRVLLKGTTGWDTTTSNLGLHPASKRARRYLRHYDGPPLRTKLVLVAKSPDGSAGTYQAKLDRRIRGRR